MDWVIILITVAVLLAMILAYILLDLCMENCKLVKPITNDGKNNGREVCPCSTRVACCPKQSFRWSEHPALIAEAIEHGWASFGFTKTCASGPSDRLLDINNRFQAVEPEIRWEMVSGIDYLQKIRMNTGLPTEKSNMRKGLLPIQSVQTALPLPGPPIGDLYFPEKAYFEITILGETMDSGGSVWSSKSFGEDEGLKLISDMTNWEEHLQNTSCEMTPTNFSSNAQGEIAVVCPIATNSSKQICSQSDCMPLGGNLKVMSVGLAVGGTSLYQLPGCEPGSVGFHSTGFFFLDGKPHMEGQKEQYEPLSTLAWGLDNTVIGCGFDLSTNEVFYTLNGELVYTLTCNSEEFSYPLYPTIASNYDVTVLVNLGQKHFEYSLANDQRVADPSQKKTLVSKSVKLPSGCFIEDSCDLFSIGRMSSQWQANLENSDRHNVQLKNLTSEVEGDSFFEIPVDEKV